MYLNESAQSLLQMSTNKAEGQMLTDLIKDNDQIVCACQKAMAGQGEIHVMRVECLEKSRERKTL